MSEIDQIGQGCVSDIPRLEKTLPIAEDLLAKAARGETQRVGLSLTNAAICCARNSEKAKYKCDIMCVYVNLEFQLIVPSHFSAP